MRSLLILLLTLAPSMLYAGFFAEGYSSPDRKTAARLQSRIFTIHTLQEACARAPAPGEIQVDPAALRMSVGQRIYRGARSDLRVIVYDDFGNVLPPIPIDIIVIPVDSSVFRARSDLDYIEAIERGSVQLIVRPLCDSESDVHGEIKVSVE